MTYFWYTLILLLLFFSICRFSYKGNSILLVGSATQYHSLMPADYKIIRRSQLPAASWDRRMSVYMYVRVCVIYIYFCMCELDIYIAALYAYFHCHARPLWW